MKNEYEYGKEINWEYIMEKIEEFQEIDEETSWELISESSKVKCWIAYDGSTICADYPLIHWEVHFSNKYPFHLIVNSITNAAKRVLWDKDIKAMKTLK